MPTQPKSVAPTPKISQLEKVHKRVFAKIELTRYIQERKKTKIYINSL
jgi:hypothetical protein